MKFFLLIFLSSPFAISVRAAEPALVPTIIPVPTAHGIPFESMKIATWACFTAPAAEIGGVSILEQLAQQVEASHFEPDPNPKRRPLFYYSPPRKTKPGIMSLQDGLANWLVAAGNSSRLQQLLFQETAIGEFWENNARLQIDIASDPSDWVQLYSTDYGFPVITYLKEDEGTVTGLNIQYRLPPGMELSRLPLEDAYTRQTSRYALNGQVYVDCLIRNLQRAAIAPK